MSLSGREIDELLAEFTGERKAKSMSNTTEIDNILLSMGKQPKVKAEKPVLVAEPGNVDIDEEDEPALKTAKKANLFRRFFEDDDDDEYNTPKKAAQTKTQPKLSKQISPKPEKAHTELNTVEIHAAEQKPAENNKFNNEMFAAAFTPKNDNSRQAPKKTDKPQATRETATAPFEKPAKEFQAQALPAKEVKPFSTAKFNDELFTATFAPAQEPAIKTHAKQQAVQNEKAKKEFDELLPVVEMATQAVAEESALIHEPTVRRAGSPEIGSLREKLLSVVKEKAFITEEDEEYAEAEKVKKIQAISQAAPQTPDITKIPQLSVKEDEIPTVEFSLHGKAVPKPSAPKAVVLSPDGKSEIPLIRRPITTVATEVDDTFRDFFGETAAVSRQEIEDGIKAKKAGALLRSIFGKRREETGELQAVFAESEIALPENENEDYNSPADAPDVVESLTSMRFNATLRAIAVGLTTLLLVYLGLSARTGLLPAISFLDPAEKPFFYLITNFILLTITGLVCVLSLISGYKALFKAPSADSITAVAFTGAVLQNAAFLFAPDIFDASKITLFAPVAAVALLFNVIGKRMQCTTVCRNFETVSAGYDHSAAYLLKSRELSVTVAKGLEQDEPSLLISRPTALVKGFLTQSFSESSKAYTSRILSFVILGASVLAFIISLIQGNNFVVSLTSFAAVCTLCAPFSATLLQAVPASLLQKNASRVGAVVPGWSAIEDLGTVNTVLINAKDLFSPASVRLHGIKTFEKERIDLAILYAASVLIEGCDTLRDIFLGVIENKTEMLYKVESLTVEPNFGFSAWIEHTRVIIGNRAMMQRHDINTPSLDYEMKYTKGEKCPIYLAVSGKLFGMFLVSYTPCEEIDEVLYNLTSAGISIVVKSDDFNITSNLISDLYGLKRNTVKVLNASERDVLAPKTAYLPESEGILTHLGSLSSFAGGLRAAAAASSGVNLSAFVQIAAVILGLILCLVLILSKSLVSISLTAVLLFQLAWTVLTVVLPFTKKY